MHFRKINFFFIIYPGGMRVLVSMKPLFNSSWMVCKLKRLLGTWELKACIRVCMLQLSALKDRENQVFWSETRARIVFFTTPPPRAKE